MCGITTAPITATAVASSPRGSAGTKSPLATSEGLAPETAARAAKEAPYIYIFSFFFHFFFIFFGRKKKKKKEERKSTKLSLSLFSLLPLPLSL